MNWKQIISSSAATGALLATLVAILMVKIGLEPPTFGSALAIFIGMVLISAWAVKKIALTNGWCTPSLKQLIPVSFLTFIIPLLGSSFGAPNSDLDTLFIIILLGTIGGIFWSIPFALWAFFRGSDPQEKTVDTTNQPIHQVIQNVTYNINDSVVTGDISPIANQDDENE